MYVDVSGTDGPYKITVTTSTETYERKWKIRVIQYTDSEYCPPKNCLQYFTESAGTVSSFNMDPATNEGQLINNLNYAVCFKSNAGFCNLQLTSEDDNFDVGDSSLTTCEDYVEMIGVGRRCGATFDDLQLNSTSLMFFQVVSDAENTNQDSGFNLKYMGLTC